MKQIVDYSKSLLQMEDLLIENDVSIKEDFTLEEREALKKQLEKYMSSQCNNELQIDLKKISLIVKGADEASYLYEYVK